VSFTETWLAAIVEVGIVVPKRVRRNLPRYQLAQIDPTSFPSDNSKFDLPRSFVYTFEAFLHYLTLSHVLFFLLALLAPPGRTPSTHHFLRMVTQPPPSPQYNANNILLARHTMESLSHIITHPRKPAIPT
jgi:hypothetical protein